MRDFKLEAARYNLNSLMELQDKRNSNILLFQDSINKERETLQQEEGVKFSLESKLKISRDLTEMELVKNDLPKIITTMQKRENTIRLLKQAIIEEEDEKDFEFKMIRYLKDKHDGSN